MMGNGGAKRGDGQLDGASWHRRGLVELKKDITAGTTVGERQP